jgi:hypothetical protein
MRMATVRCQPRQPLVLLSPQPPAADPAHRFEGPISCFLRS